MYNFMIRYATIILPALAGIVGGVLSVASANSGSPIPAYLACPFAFICGIVYAQVKFCQAHIAFVPSKEDLTRIRSVIAGSTVSAGSLVVLGDDGKARPVPANSLHLGPEYRLKMDESFVNPDCASCEPGISTVCYGPKVPCINPFSFIEKGTISIAESGPEDPSKHADNDRSEPSLPGPSACGAAAIERGPSDPYVKSLESTDQELFQQEAYANPDYRPEDARIPLDSLKPSLFPSPGVISPEQREEYLRQQREAYVDRKEEPDSKMDLGSIVADTHARSLDESLFGRRGPRTHGPIVPGPRPKKKDL